MKTKEETLYCRMTADMKARVETEARLRGESSSVIVREALREYFEAKGERELRETPAAQPKRRAA